MLKKPLPIGIENYKELLDKNYYYVDKTWMVKELLDDGGKVNLFTRPRRFGKTLALSMIRTYFEKVILPDGTVMDNRHYFDGSKIQSAGEDYSRHMGKYPVISLSLKSAKQPDYHMAYESMVDELIKEYVRHNYILDSECLTEEYREKYEALMNRRAEPISYAKSLAFLSECLKRYHKTNVIILVDEYDVPLENAYFRGFYDPMIDFLRSLFESALKTNDSLEFAVITGCLRISRESIFTGLNNLKIHSILDNNFAEYFGFTQIEVERMLSFYKIDDRIAEVKEWYDGYLFGQTEVYNPWSVINYTDTAARDNVGFLKPYWSNTSSNSIVRELVENADTGMKQELEALIAGNTIEKPIHEDITYEDIHRNQENLWNFLFFTGYLRAVTQRFEADTIYLTMRIPNAEIRYIYRNTIREWFDTAVRQADFKPFYQALKDRNTEAMENFINGQLVRSISYYDSQENFYHGYLFGILSAMEGYAPISNREAGDGRPDILLEPFDPRNAAFIIEIKCVEKYNQMEDACQKALRQIEEKHYDAELLDKGIDRIIKYGVCFCRKNCMIRAFSEKTS